MVAVRGRVGHGRARAGAGTRARWLGPVRIVTRTRSARRASDPAGVMRALTRGADRAVGMRSPLGQALIVTHPDLVGEVLVQDAGSLVKGPGLQLTRPLLGDGLLTSEGADHERARRLVAPAFAPRRLTAYTEGFSACTLERLGTWQDGTVVDLRAEMATLTLELVGRTLLGVDLTEHAGRVRDSLESALRLFDEVSVGVLALAGGRRGARGARRAAGPGGVRMDPELIRPIHEAVGHIIEERRLRPSEDRGDVLTALLQSSREPDGLTDSEVHDHVMTLLLAGHETTAGALTWTLDLVGRHPEVQRRLHEESDTLGGAPAGFESLRSLPYTRAVLSESMRLRPPAWILGRSTTTDLDVAEWHLPAGAMVIVSPLLLHTDPRWWPAPERFDPQRWLDGSGASRPRNAYLPFGTGPRSCIGEQFAWAEATTVLALVASRWELTPVLDAPPRPQYRVTMRPGDPVPTRLRLRDRPR